MGSCDDPQGLIAQVGPQGLIAAGPSIYQSIDLSIQTRVWRSIDLSIDLSIYLSIYPSIHPSIHPSIYLSTKLVCKAGGSKRLQSYQIPPPPHP